MQIVFSLVWLLATPVIPNAVETEGLKARLLERIESHDRRACPPPIRPGLPGRQGAADGASLLAEWASQPAVKRCGDAQLALERDQVAASAVRRACSALLPSLALLHHNTADCFAGPALIWEDRQILFWATLGLTQTAKAIADDGDTQAALVLLVEVWRLHALAEMRGTLVDIMLGVSVRRRVLDVAIGLPTRRLGQEALRQALRLLHHHISFDQILQSEALGVAGAHAAEVSSAFGLDGLPEPFREFVFHDLGLSHLATSAEIALLQWWAADNAFGEMFEVVSTIRDDLEVIQDRLEPFSVQFDPVRLMAPTTPGWFSIVAAEAGDGRLLRWVLSRSTSDWSNYVRRIGRARFLAEVFALKLRVDAAGGRCVPAQLRYGRVSAKTQRGLQLVSNHWIGPALDYRLECAALEGGREARR